MSENSPKQPQNSLLRQIVYGLLIIFLLIAIGFGGILLFTTLAAIQGVKTVTQPVSQFVQDLTTKATPVILPDPVTIVREVRQLSRLETASYSLQKIITAERNQDVLFGILGESLIFVAVGDVYAGIDLTKLEESDVQIIDPNTIMIHLPEAEILHASLDNENSYVADRDQGLLASMDAQLETQVRQQAEKAILEEALSAGILTEANENARESIQSFLTKLGFENIIFTDAPPPPAPPYEQEIPKGMILVTITPTP